MLEMASRVSNAAIKPDAEKQPIRRVFMWTLNLDYYPRLSTVRVILPRPLSQQRGIIDCGDDMDKRSGEKRHPDWNVDGMPERHQTAG